ncbi:MAG: AMP-binding protein [Tidjanibacter sp.]|nr:AMP-binding protein [Tidjanibacter sp.]
MQNRTLKQLFDNSIRLYGSNAALSTFGQTPITYNEVASRANQLRDMLTGAGVGSGDKVAILATNSPNWVVGYFTVVSSGMVAVPILPDFSGEQLDQIIAHSEAKALLVTDKLFGKLSHETVSRMNIIVRLSNMGVVARRCDQKAEIVEPQPDDTAVIIYTSGTTSAPKGVMLSHKALCAQIDIYNTPEVFPVYADDVFLSILPLSHTYECSVGMIYPFSAGAQVVYLDRMPTASALMPAFREVRPTIMLSVPLIMEKIYRTQVVARFTGSKIGAALYSHRPFARLIHRIAGKALKKLMGGRMRFFGIGGAKLDAATEQFMRDAHFPYAIGYGLTETAPLLFAAPPQATHLQSAGHAIPGVEARLDNINPLTGEGELVVRTPSIMQGYYKNPEITAEAFTADGWFRTKDLCTLSAEGLMTVHGRAGNMIVGASGENIYPEEIESVINTHRLVSESIVVADNGALVALVQLNREELEKRFAELKGTLAAKSEEVKSEIKEYVNSRVSRFSRVAVVVEQAEGFEKTPTMKIKRYLYNKKK